VFVEFICSPQDPDWRLQVVYYFIPVVGPILFMLGCNTMVLYRLFLLIGRRDSVSYESSMRVKLSSTGELQEALPPSVFYRFHEGMSRLDEKSRAIALRILLLPLFYLLNPLAGALVFLTRQEELFVYVLIDSCVGLFNCFVWVGLDAAAVRVWKRLVLRACCCSTLADRQGEENPGDGLLTDQQQSHHFTPEAINSSL
jgi:hypothetical protein